MSFHGPRAVPPSNGIPIVGEPIAIHSWFPVVNFTCKCEKPVIMMTAGLGTVSQCPNCGRHWQLGMGYDQASNSVTVMMVLIVPNAPPDAKPS